jgi:hypothetical protein
VPTILQNWQFKLKADLSIIEYTHYQHDRGAALPWECAYFSVVSPTRLG